MAYKALYRKYRPHNFEEVVGQQAIIKTLQNIIKEDKIGHAYLFSGPRGTGKTSVAKLFAKTVNCVNTKDGFACNECEICKYIDSDNTSDIIEIDAASNNGVDEIRELKNKINLVPAKCKYKVYIIDEVHMLSIGAFNALLKTLEEPPKHVIFILATTEMQKIPLTILSRCQNFNFKKITEDKIEEKINYIVEKEKIKIDEESIKEIAILSDGGMRDAIGLLEQLSSFEDNGIIIDDVYQISGTTSLLEITELIKDMSRGKINNLFVCVDKFYQDGKDFIRLAEKMILLLRDVLLYKKAPDYLAKKQQDNHLIYEDICNFINDEDIYVYINEIQLTVENMKTTNHPKILFEIMLLKLSNGKREKKEFTSGEPLIDIHIPEKEEKVENIQDIVKKEKKEMTKMDTEYKKALINNTLALAGKDYLKEFEEKWQQLHTYLINKDYKSSATILLDGRVVAASNDHVIIVYKYNAILEKFEDGEGEIRKLITKMMGREYIVVALIEEEWLETREHYVKMKKEKKEITILPEIENSKEKNEAKANREKTKSKEITDAIDIFGEELIEMKG